MSDSNGITTIIPSRGLTALLRLCLERLSVALQPIAGSHRIIVIDNASPRPYLSSDFDLPGIELLRCDTQQSYAAACNRGARHAPNDWLLLLNNDVLLHPAALRGLLAASQPADIGICGSRLVFPDDSIQHCGVVFGRGERGPYHDYRCLPSEQVPRQTRSLQAVTGACLLLRRDCFEQLDGLDESYPFGLEDIDLCLRARQAGWKIRCDQSCDSLHFESMTEGRIALDEPSRRHFMQQWQGHYSIDGE